MPILAQHLPQTSIATLAVGASMLLILVISKRFSPRAPAPLVAVGRTPRDETFPGLLIVRSEGRIFFANAQSVGDRARSPAARASGV